jgi:hypothetical protein
MNERAAARKVFVQKARRLSRPQAYEVWQAMQLISAKGSVAQVPDLIMELALHFHQSSATWKVIADKALEHEHLSEKNCF